ncbi:hypothetical protein Kpol_480p3 [Vanderwaltozyma polyspora DSM 70294]|uniref:GH16 domain-containing protein n=1 Tax=Vanderwaltozyma polyspora (strain ATCC 22028 / DSM 70294 / BCRC 21397 / CBS 2163 / NBRC 10782 / NRRL Y-8283 / UCD 57-17) TaxID=436907 RepID=A7TP65_VANPO|nr:uncharacterized protein Kpol_480p3 [Vanderwaltozyma polyspora DSM 70294]EDO15916.1 hypothetical protein Kpol_480p3 [Vanderwaltozyma polyspora DSM 70294]
MARRNLTNNQSVDDLYNRDENPFLQEDSENSLSSMRFNNNTNENSEDSLIQHHVDSNINTSFNPDVSDYQGYYSKNTSRIDANINNNNGSNMDLSYMHPPNSTNNLLNSNNGGVSNIRGSSTSLNTGLSTNDILSPPQFDRYPQVQSGNRSLAMGTPNPNGNGSSQRAYSSSPGMVSNSSFLSSSNPFVPEQDFSPFGGYPATSFPLHIDEKEDDDYLHNPDPEEEARLDRKRFSEDFKHMDKRSAGGWVGIIFLFMAGIFIFIVLPAVTFTGVIDHTSPAPRNVTDYLTAYQYPQLASIRTSLVDPDTPSTAKTRTAKDGSSWKLVFSDEFNAEGRTFYDGDDQFWTAPDIHYDATKDLEWYSPDAVTTKNGTLKLRMDAFKNHDLYYRSGMVQSWNKMCFTQGALEVSANLPNYGRVTGLWPGLWTMGNLARPGYLGSTEGLWPYSYEGCDAGITPNQSSFDGISYLPGQRLSVCTCDGEDHPNQGTGRGAPEIDILEAEADTTIGVGVASQSLQIAPFDVWYIPDYEFIEIYNFTTTTMNSYCGGPLQQAVSAVTTLNTTWYQFGPEGGYYQKYAIEYLNDKENGYLRWFVGDVPTFTIYSKALHPNGNIDWRYISREPMSIIMNLGISNNWAYIDWQSIYFPVTMSIDYVRLYQPSNAVNIDCDPDSHPTYDYIESHLNAYHNPNLTSWEEAGYSFPKNILTGNCKSSKYSLSNE